MRIFIYTLLVAFIIFLNYVQSSPMPMWPSRHLHVQLPRMIPNLPIPPRLAYQNGQLVGVYYNGKVYAIEQEQGPEPAPRPLSRSLLPDNALLYRYGVCHGIVLGSVIYDMAGERITTFRTGDLVIYSGAPVAIYDNDSFREFHQPSFNE